MHKAWIWIKSDSKVFKKIEYIVLKKNHWIQKKSDKIKQI